ncbi:MAG TPA: hypothetical protein VIL86_19545, partial [Tepidisphaeraceae bacterium]
MDRCSFGETSRPPFYIESGNSNIEQEAKLCAPAERFYAIRRKLVGGVACHREAPINHLPIRGDDVAHDIH